MALHEVGLDPGRDVPDTGDFQDRDIRTGTGFVITGRNIRTHIRIRGNLMGFSTLDHESFGWQIVLVQ